MLKRLLKSIYKITPFKKHFFSFVKLFWLLPKRITKHLYFNGFFNLKIDKGRSFIFLAHSAQIDNELFWYGLYGGWEKYSQRLWIQMCAQGGSILDVGANDGLYSLAARRVNSEARIIAAEPLDFVLRRFYQNIQANEIDDIEVLPIAFSNYIGEARMFVPKGADYIRSATVNDNLFDRPPDKIDTIKIKVNTIKNYFETNGISDLDLVKIDVESHEPEVIEGMGDLLEKHKPSFIIEVSYERVPDLLNKQFEGHGYLFFNINEETESARRQEKLTLSDSDNFLICQLDVAQKLNLV